MANLFHMDSIEGFCLRGTAVAPFLKCMYLAHHELKGVFVIIITGIVCYDYYFVSSGTAMALHRAVCILPSPPQLQLATVRKDPP